MLHCVVDDFLWPWTEEVPVLMMHGYARNASFWNRWIPTIAKARRVYRPELRGCGMSAVPAEGYRFTTDTITHDILAVLDHFGLEAVHWVGESSGGIIGLSIAATHPERIASLVVCNSPVRISESLKRTYALDQSSTAAAIMKYGVGEWCRRTLRYRLDLEHASPYLRDWYVSEMDKTRPHVAASLIECFEGVDVASLLGHIRVPVLVMSGDKSAIASEQQHAMTSALPDARLHLFAGYGHGINLLRPEECAALALDFYGSV